MSIKIQLSDSHLIRKQLVILTYHTPHKHANARRPRESQFVLHIHFTQHTSFLPRSSDARLQVMGAEAQWPRCGIMTMTPSYWIYSNDTPGGGGGGTPKTASLQSWPESLSYIQDSTFNVWHNNNTAEQSTAHWGGICCWDKKTGFSAQRT